MKKVEAIIRHLKLDDVIEALGSVGIQGMTVTEVMGFGRQKGRLEVYRGAEHIVDLVPKVKIEMVIPSDMVDQVIEKIRLAAGTGRVGDGKIFVRKVEAAVRIRTGERYRDALSNGTSALF